MHKKNRLDQKVDRLPILDIEDFFQSFKDLTHFCSIIEKQELSVQISMKDYVVIRLVSLIEYYLKALISELIDEMTINPKRIMPRDPTITINLDFLQRFKLEHYTTGRIILAHFDRMNPKLIYDLMSRINRLDYFAWYSSIIATITTQTNMYERIKQLYTKRNDVVHNLISTDFTVKELNRSVTAFKNFSLHLIIFTRLNLGINERHWSETRQLEECALISGVKDLPKFLQEFKKITKKLRDDYPSSRFQ